MSIEKAFAIHASPDAIFRALTDELESAAADSDGAFEVLRSNAPESIDLRVAHDHGELQRCLIESGRPESSLAGRYLNDQDQDHEKD